jgi:hypothetical protein
MDNLKVTESTDAAYLGEPSPTYQTVIGVCGVYHQNGKFNMGKKGD